MNSDSLVCNGACSEKIVLKVPFIDFAARFSALPGTVILMSGGDLDCSRYHILGAMPWLTFSGRGQNLSVKTSEGTLHCESDPIDMLQMILSRFKLTDFCQTVPFSAGLMGYLSYDLKDSLEKLPKTSVDDTLLPHILFFAPSIIVVHDKKDNETYLNIKVQNKDMHDVVNEFEAIAHAKSSAGKMDIYTGEFKSCFSRETYIAAINKIKEYIKAGDVYQVNMSQRFKADFSGDAYDLFRILYEKNPAPFFSFINAGDHQIISTSPERFVRRKGDKLETRPIKGTRPRGMTLSEDERQRGELINSVKDDAELSMIVDLLRNDLGKVCRGGSVYVSEHKRIETYSNVHHLVSIVEGTLESGRDSADIIRAVFPGGSITGCPKIRAMEIIDELEPFRRHIYTGSIGYISFHDTMDLSIAIRTATVAGGTILYSTGGGIVFDSNPEDEYDETLHKGKTILELFKPAGEKSEVESYIWHNGLIKQANSVTVSAESEGFLYGYGFFETIRVCNGNPSFLEEHISRFNEAWKFLFEYEPPDLTWEDIVNMVITENGLSDKTASIKILAAKGGRKIPPYDHNLIVMAKPYTHRLYGRNGRGLNLAMYNEPRQTPLARFKTLNYLYYLLAGKWAKERGFDEALILNPDGSISETNSANILMIKGRRIITPLSPHSLPGVMEKAVCALLSGREYSIEKGKIFPEEIFSGDGVILTNSLMGAVPAERLDEKELADTSALCAEINRELL
jgi:para-aminobenzoate synthetase component 1